MRGCSLGSFLVSCVGTPRRPAHCAATRPNSVEAAARCPPFLSIPRRHRFAALPATIAGCIFDSAPVFPGPGALARVLASVEPSPLRRWALLASNAAKRGVHRALGVDGAARFWGRMQRLSWGRPLLYLYSADDPLCDAAQVSLLVQEKQRRGHDVRARCWARSEHVAHMRHHRAEYTSLLLGFLEDAAAPPQGQGSGGGAAGGLDDAALAATAEAAAQPPRSRL